jgi:hypothetical protein
MRGQVSRSAIAVFVALAVIAKPASAQDAGNGGWLIQGGPAAGVSSQTHVGNIEYAFRLGILRDKKAYDLTLSTINLQFSFFDPSVRHRTFEALVGRSWHFSSKMYVPGLGFRSGYANTPNGWGERFHSIVLGPHTSLGVPLGPLLALRGEGGFHIYISGMGPAGPRGYLRLGIEGRSRPR